MKTKLKIILGISLFLNVIILAWFLMPKAWFLTSTNWYGENKSFTMGGFANAINFKSPKNTYEAYIIYGVLSDSGGGMAYYYTDLIGNRGGLVSTELKPLYEASNNSNELILKDNIYTFTIDKKNSKVFGKDKDGNTFELGFHYYKGF